MTVTFIRSKNKIPVVETENYILMVHLNWAFRGRNKVINLILIHAFSVKTRYIFKFYSNVDDLRRK